MRIQILPIRLDPGASEGKAEAAKTRQVFNSHIQRAAEDACEDLADKHGIHVNGVHFDDSGSGSR